MKIHTALSRSETTAEAVAGACHELAAAFAGRRIDLAFVFFTPHHLESAQFLASMLEERLHPQVMLGCSAESVIEGVQEIEGQPALCVWAAHLPGTNLTSFHLKFEQTEDGFTTAGWPEQIPSHGDNLSLVLIGEPFSTPIEALLQELKQRYPRVPAIGGMASAAHHPGANRLIYNGRTLEDGAIGVALSGSVCIRTVVSQGCRPIGDRFMITLAEQNIIHELSGKAALDRLREVFSLLTPAEQRQAERALHLGIVIDEHKDQFDRGDFLIRNLIGADQQTGSFALGDIVKEGQTVQFQLRDAAAASEDLHALLTGERAMHGGKPPLGALIFSCNGRGHRFFRAPHHDANAIREEMGALPVGGFFAMGEIGPVGGNNFLHSYTASVALFCPSESVS